MIHSLDNARRLYVLTEGTGYTCLGFEVCRRRTENILSWLRGKHPATYAQLGERDLSPPLGSEEAYLLYERLCVIGQRVNAQTGDRCLAELTPRLAGLEGKRVEVIDTDGDRRRFWVGRSTGWMPCHLELKTRRSHGGMAVYGAPFREMRVLQERR